MWKRTYSHRRQTKHNINYYLWLTKLVTPFKNKNKNKKLQWWQNGYSQNNTERLIFRIYLEMKRKNTWKLPSWKALCNIQQKIRCFTTRQVGLLNPTCRKLFCGNSHMPRMCTTTLLVELKNWRKPKWSKEHAWCLHMNILPLGERTCYAKATNYSIYPCEVCIRKEQEQTILLLLLRLHQ